MVPTVIDQGQPHKLAHRSIGKDYSDFLSRGSDDEASNLSMASGYDDQSTFSSDDANALREKSNARMQKVLGNGSYVPDVAPGSAVLNETGFFVKGEGSGVLGDDEVHQQVPVSKYEELELRILRQPEEQHRARYMSEGSRGSVKDRSGKSHVTVALRGFCRPAVLEIFAAIGSGSVIPHPLYRLIPVTGKNGSSVTTCKEGLTADGAPCLQVVLRPENKMTAVLDCIGILKICSYDLKRKLPKQNRSASVRLVFRVTVPNPQDRRQNVILQTVSLPIVCAQQPGYPDVSRISCTSSSVRGNVDVFIVGKNFSNNATVYMKEYGPDGKVIWSAPATVDQQHIHTCHMICTVPPYRDLYANKCVEVMMTVECGKKVSRPLSFKYLPDNPVSTSAQGQLQQQVAYNPSYTLDSLGGASSSTSDPSTQQNYQMGGGWASTDFSSGMAQDQQQYQQQALLPSTASDPQPSNPPMTLPSAAVAQSFSDFVEPTLNTAKLEPLLDEQNSFYYSNQLDKPPAAKRLCTEENFVANDPFGFSLEDLPQLLT